MGIEEENKIILSSSLIGLAESFHGSHNAQLREIFSQDIPISGIFIELPNDYQNSVNQYLKTGDFDEELASHFAGAEKEGKAVVKTTQLVFDYAKTHFKPVICIDSSKTLTVKYNQKSKFGYWFLNGESRDADMFSIIKDNFKENEKWLILGGIEHLKEGLHRRTGLDTLGERLTKYFGQKYRVIQLD